MGGSAFSSYPNPPYTPRMLTAVYNRVRDELHRKLREIFVYVASPIPGPAKEDHGDIDILVAGEKATVFPSAVGDGKLAIPGDPLALVKEILGAEYTKFLPGPSANFAIPWPSDADEDEDGDSQMTEVNSNASAGESEPKKYIQIDVRICSDIDHLCWILFKHAHGDIWNLVGSTIRPFGLTVDEEALWLRIPEIEAYDRNSAKVMLTKDPVAVLRFLGLAVDNFWEEPFPSVEAMFDYVTTCRLFWVRPMTEEDEGNVDGAGVSGGEVGTKRLKHNDRRRMKGRPVYRRWIYEFIPKLQAEGKFKKPEPAKSTTEQRKQVRDEAFSYFLVQGKYQERLNQWRAKRSALDLKGAIKALFPDMEPHTRGCTISGFKKILLEGDGALGIAPPDGLKDAHGIYDMDVARDFIAKNWEEVARVARAYNQQRAREHMALKEAKEALKKENMKMEPLEKQQPKKAE